MKEVTLEQIAQMIIEKDRNGAFAKAVQAQAQTQAQAQAKAEAAEAKAEASEAARVQARVQAKLALAIARIEAELVIIKKNTIIIMGKDVYESSYSYRAR